MRRWAGAIAVLLALAACGSSTENAALKLSPALLTNADVRAEISDATLVRVSDLGSYEDRDQRGPCGARVLPLDITHAVGVGLGSSSVSGVELVVQAKVTTLRTYFAQRRADTHAGCPEFRTETAQGTQRVKLDRIVTLRVNVDEALAIQRATLLSGRATSVTTIELRRRDVVARLVLFAPTPLDESVVQGLATKMATRLASLPDS